MKSNGPQEDSRRFGLAGRPLRLARWSVFLIWLFPLGTPLLDRADSVGYLAPAISLAEDGDLLYYDEYRELGMNERYFRPTPTGLVGNHWNVGLGVALAPVLLAAEQLGGRALGPVGQTALQSLSLLWAALVVASGLALVRRHVFDRPGMAALVVAGLVVGTPLAFYIHAQGARPHALEALLTTLLVLRCLDSWTGPRARDYLVMGVIVGALFLVRTQSGAILVLPMTRLGLDVWKERKRLRGQAQELASRALGLLAPVLVFRGLGGWHAQLLYGEEGRTSVADALLNVEINPADTLFHPHHGLFPWSPVLLLALVGFVLFARRRPAEGAALAVFFLLQLYLNATSFDQSVDAYHYTRHWAGGGSFGARRFLGCLPVFLLGLGELMGRMRSRPAKLALVFTISICALWSANLSLYARLHPYPVLEEHMSWERLVSLQGQALSDLGGTFAALWAMRPAAWDAVLGFLCVALPLVVVLVARAAAEALSAPLCRRRHLLAIAASAALVGTFVIAGLRTIEKNTEQARTERAEELAVFADVSARNAWRVERGILVEQASLRDLTEDAEGSLDRYRRALLLGIGETSLRRYLEIAAREEGGSGALSRLGELTRAHPEHPLLKRLAPGGNQSRQAVP